MIPTLQIQLVKDEGLRTVLKQIDDAITSVQRQLSDVSEKAKVPMIAGGGSKATLTDNSGGTAGNTIAAITDVPTKNAIATLTKSVNALIPVVQQLARVQP